MHIFDRMTVNDISHPLAEGCISSYKLNVFFIKKDWETLTILVTICKFSVLTISVLCWYRFSNEKWHLIQLQKKTF